MSKDKLIRVKLRENAQANLLVPEQQADTTQGRWFGCYVM